MNIANIGRQVKNYFCEHADELATYGGIVFTGILALGIGYYTGYFTDMTIRTKVLKNVVQMYPDRPIKEIFTLIVKE